MKDASVSFKLKVLAVGFIFAIAFIRGMRKVCPKKK